MAQVRRREVWRSVFIPGLPSRSYAVILKAIQVDVETTGEACNVIDLLRLALGRWCCQGNGDGQENRRGGRLEGKTMLGAQPVAVPVRPPLDMLPWAWKRGQGWGFLPRVWSGAMKHPLLSVQHYTQSLGSKIFKSLQKCLRPGKKYWLQNIKTTK